MKKVVAGGEDTKSKMHNGLKHGSVEQLNQRLGYVVSLETAISYIRAWRWQLQLAERYKNAGCSMRDTLILLQHPPVYTLGQGADIKFLKFAPESKHYELHRVERGGEVTYHCPGQVVGYPILDLKQHRMDLHWYLRQLEEVIILVLAEYGLQGDRLEGMTGVWVKGYKVAAIGIKVSRWITMHGFALNVCPDMGGFERIIPCGLEGKLVGSIAQFVPDISLKQVQQTLIEQFEQVFGLTFQPVSISDLNLSD